MKGSIVKVNKAKSSFFDKINKIENLWQDSARKKREESNQ